MLTDADLIQIAEAALTDSYTRAGDWMACKPGCHQCCIGVFLPITTTPDRRPSPRRARHSRPGSSRSHSTASIRSPHPPHTKLPRQRRHWRTLHRAAPRRSLRRLRQRRTLPRPRPNLRHLRSLRRAANSLPYIRASDAVRTTKAGWRFGELCFVGAPESEDCAAVRLMQAFSSMAGCADRLWRNTNRAPANMGSR